jgi:serine/threonine protein kinase
MANNRAPEDLLSTLVPGMQVGTWRVVERHAQGAYGVVYRVLRVGQEGAAPAALKVSLHPWDMRFTREAELLSRLDHPGLPRLLDRGVLRHVSGVEHPYFVMQWVEGTPLYAWAQQLAPSHQQLCQVLAQLARTLAAIHASGAVHRDVKGDNVLVHPATGQAILIDFGSGHYQGAPRMTWQSLAPGTSAYRSAQANLFHIRSVREPDSYYPPSPADDVFALGVTAYRLLLSEYPPPMDVHEDESGSWQVSSPDPRPLLERNPRVEPRLRELILRMLSDSPEARGTAAELAEALDAAAAEAHHPESHQAPQSVEVAPPRARGRAFKPWLALAAATMAAVLMWTFHSLGRRGATNSQAPEVGTSAVGDSATAPLTSAHPPSDKEPVSQDTALQPRPGQTLPDDKGRCPMPKQVPFNGGCWVETSSITYEECVGSGYAYFKGKCYSPALAPPKKTLPTSGPTEAR